MRYSVYDKDGNFLTHVEADNENQAVERAKICGHDDAAKAEEMAEHEPRV